MGATTTTNPIQILVLKVPLPGNLGATGSPNWDATCGIANTSIHEKLMGGGQDLPNGFFDGIIRINSDISDATWHTLSEDPTISSSELDLYSVVLHEALHVLGFASRIGADGMPLDIFNSSGDVLIETDAYSVWDKHLFSTLNNQFLIESILEPTECCDQHTFNNNEFPGMPIPVNGDCTNGIIFNGSSVNPPNVNNLENLDLMDPDINFAVANKLSHLEKLDIVCNPNGEDYVMHPGIPLGPEGKNRIISGVELEIMCDLGYNIVNSCEDQCIVIAQNDFVIKTINSVQGILLNNQILNNDFLPTDYEIEFNLECGNLPSGTASYSGGNVVSINYDLLSPNLYSFCYDVIGCNGEWCDDGTVFLYLGLEECDNECNLFCNGDFEAFLPRSSNFYDQLGLSPVIFNGNLTGGNSPEIIYGEPENKYLDFLRPYNNAPYDFESLYLPLAKPIDPGCSTTISFRAAASEENATLQFYASNNPPCSTPELPSCDPLDGFESCTDYILHCMTVPPSSDINQPDGVEIDFTSISTVGVSLIFGNPDNIVPYPYDIDVGNIHYKLNEPEWGFYSFNWTNETSETINFITIIGGSTSPPTNDFIRYYMDDIEIISNCENQVSVFPTYPDPACIGDNIIVDYLVCHTGPGTDLTDVQLTIEDLPQGIVFGMGGDFINGEVLLENVPPNGPCQNVSLELVVGSNFQPGTSVTIPMDVELQNACWGDFASSTVELNFENCCILPLEPGFTNQSDQNDCEYVVNFFSNTTDNSLSHGWDFNGDGSTDSTLPNPSWPFGTFGDFQVTHTVTNICGSTASTTELVNIVECIDLCLCPSGSIIIDPNTTVDISNLTASTSSTCFQVGENAQLVINEDVQIFGSTFIMDSGAEIVVNNDIQFNSVANNYRGCTNMWKGITLGENASLFVLYNTIMDAQYAIKIPNDATINVRDSNFDRNYVGIFASAPSGIFGSPNIAVTVNGLSGVRFKCTEDLLPIYSGQSPIPVADVPQGPRSYAGILVNAVDYFPVISGASSPNGFDGLRNGILAYRTMLDVENAEIENLIGSELSTSQSFNFYNNDNISSYQQAGIGILNARSASFEVSNANIDNAFMGIYSHYSNINGTGVSSNIITNVVRGIRAFGGSGYQINIGGYNDTWNSHPNRNTITASEEGIGLYNMRRAFINVRDNKVERSNDGPNAMVGIGIYNSKLAPVSQGYQVANIEFNEVELTNNSTNALNIDRGIEVSGCDYVKLEDNFITEIDSPGEKHLISLTGNYKCQVRENTATRSGSTSNAIGIDVINTTTTVYCCNTLEQMKIGTRFSGMCKGTKFNGTAFNDISERGLLLLDGAIIGVQGDHINDPNVNFLPGNTWGLGAGAEHQGQSASDFADSRFFYNQNYPSPAPNPSEWFSFEPTVNDMACANQPQCDIAEEAFDGPIDEGDVKIASDGLSPALYGGGIQWEGSRYLYKRLMATPGLASQNQSVNGFYTNNANTNLAEYFQIKENVNNLYSASDTETVAMNNKREELINKLFSVKQKDELLMTLPEEDHPPVLAEKALLLAELHVLNDELETIIHQWESIQQGIISGINNQNNGVVAGGIFEQNQKAINEVSLNTVLGNNYAFNSNELSAIKEIAEQCPLSGGNTVFAARGLLRLAENTTFNEDACGASVEDEKERESDDNESILNVPSDDLITVYPNPTNGHIVINFYEALEEKQVLDIFDLTGKQVASYELSSGRKQINLNISNLSDGVYVYRLEINGKVSQGKIVLIND